MTDAKPKFPVRVHVAIAILAVAAVGVVVAVGYFIEKAGAR